MPAGLAAAQAGVRDVSDLRRHFARFLSTSPVRPERAVGAVGHPPTPAPADTGLPADRAEVHSQARLKVPAGSGPSVVEAGLCTATPRRGTLSVECFSVCKSFGEEVSTVIKDATAVFCASLSLTSYREVNVGLSCTKP